MTNNKIYPILVVIIGLCIGCSEFIEKPLKNEKVVVITPGDGVKTSIYTQTFWWEELDGATGYNLQVVENLFDSLPIYKIDTITKRNKFTFTLRPGKYQWKVLGVNANGKSEKFTLQTLQIDSTSLGIQTLTLNSPSDQFITRNANIQLSWQSIFGASSYRVNIARNDSVILNAVQNRLVYNYVIPKDGTYAWQVKALSKNDSTDWSEKRNFILDTRIDTTKLSFPKNNANINISEVSTTLTLIWTNVSTADNLTLNVTRERPNSSSIFSKTFTSSENPQVLFKNLNITVLSGDVIKWSITSNDTAGNQAKTSTWSFNIQ